MIWIWPGSFELRALNFKAVLLFKGKFLCMGWNCGFPCSAMAVFSLMQNENEELSIILRLFWGWYRLWTTLYQNTLVYIIVNNFCLVASILFCVHRNCSRSSQEPLFRFISLQCLSFLASQSNCISLWHPLNSQGKNSFGRVGQSNRGKSFCFGKQRATRDHWLWRKIFIRGVQMQDWGAFAIC